VKFMNFLVKLHDVCRVSRTLQTFVKRETLQTSCWWSLMKFSWSWKKFQIPVIRYPLVLPAIRGTPSRKTFPKASRTFYQAWHHVHVDLACRFRQRVPDVLVFVWIRHFRTAVWFVEPRE
jgi:hypothetical protein